jgi:ketosteroid isomerase-like protein
MQNYDILIRYYEYANAGDWDRWCDLFAENMTMDEQLAGHIEGQAKLRSLMAGFKNMYSSFQNVPQHFIVDGGQGAVVSRITAVSVAGKNIGADVMNYFRISGDKIIYMANFHDTAPFQVLAQA